MGYGLKVRRAPKAETRRRVEEVASMLGLTELLERKPAQLSGGQRQRVAMGRAIVREPRAFLMDEPLSNLDAKLRVGMRASLAELHARLGVTTIYVTHDQTEAMTLGQRVAVMRDGRIVQVDEPQALYAQAAGRVRRRVHRLSVDEPRRGRRRGRLGPLRQRTRSRSIPARTAREGRPRGPRHSARRRSRTPAFADPSAPAGSSVQVDVLEQLGADTHACFRVDARRPEVDLGSDADDAALLPEQTTLFTARSIRAPTAGRDRACTARRRSGAFHFFDVETGARARAPSPRTATETRAGAGRLAENWS